MATRHILAIDGGGVRGIVAAVLLDALETERQALGATRPLSDCFDLIAGTSTGAIVAAGLAAPNAVSDGPRRSPSQLRDLYRTGANSFLVPIAGHWATASILRTALQARAAYPPS